LSLLFTKDTQVKDVVDPNTGETHKISLESGHKVEWVVEDNYKFKLSSFKEPLQKWLEDNKGLLHRVVSLQTKVIIPAFRQEEVKKLMLKLEDLSISRTGDRIRWALEVPNDPKHTIYVWLDALTNYLTAAGKTSPSYSFFTEY
jgi:methionyl-tRNA synthetase